VLLQTITDVAKTVSFSYDNTDCWHQLCTVCMCRQYVIWVILHNRGL